MRADSFLFYFFLYLFMFYHKHSFLKQHECESYYQKKKGMRICFGVQQAPLQALFCTWWPP